MQFLPDGQQSVIPLTPISYSSPQEEQISYNLMMQNSQKVEEIKPIFSNKPIPINKRETQPIPSRSLNTIAGMDKNEYHKLYYQKNKEKILQQSKNAYEIRMQNRERERDNAKALLLKIYSKFSNMDLSAMRNLTDEQISHVKLTSDEDYSDFDRIYRALDLIIKKD